MELSILHIYIEHIDYKGIIRFCIRREFHNLCIEMRLFRITLQSDTTIESFKNNLKSDPCNPNLVEIIPTKQVLKDVFYLVESEQFVDYITAIPDTLQEKYQVSLGKNLDCVLDRHQLKRIYNFFNSFVTNFALLDSIFKLYINMIDLKEEKLELKQETPTLKIEVPEVIDQKPDLAPKSEIEYILDNYCINNYFRFFVIHNIFNHLRYCVKSLKIDQENKVITLPILFDSYYYNLNYDYINTILKISFLDLEENIYSFNSKKILDSIINYFGKVQDSDSDLVLITLLFIFYCYNYRTILKNFPNFDMVNYFNFETQSAAMDMFIKSSSPSVAFTVKFLEEIDDSKLVEDISNKYKHLIPVSEIDFLDLAVLEYQKQKDFKIKDFKVSNEKIIDLDLLMQTSSTIDKIANDSSKTINTSTYNSRSCTLTILNYDQKIITKAYNYFKEYLSNPTTISSLLSLKNTPIPKQVINLFDFFSRNLNKMYSNNSNNNTLSYYKILLDHLPSPQAYSHQAYLYLIYNIVIPYHYENFKITKFVDVFL